MSHSFGLPEDKALQSVTSVPARSIQQDHRICFIRPGYDADLVIWDSHPLSVGATTVQVFVDGREILDAKSSHKNLETSVQRTNLAVPKSRPSMRQEEKQSICSKAVSPDTLVVFTGIKHVLLDTPSTAAGEVHARGNDTFTMTIANGKITCLDLESQCHSWSGQNNVLPIKLDNGYITLGLVAFGNNIGILDISSEPSTGDGSPGRDVNALKSQKYLHFAKHGVHFGGRGFGRARIGGVTKAITAPISGGGLLQGVSVGLRTGENATILADGIWKNEVALHFAIGQEAEGQFGFESFIFANGTNRLVGDDTPTTSSAIERLRQVLGHHQVATEVADDAYMRASNGSLPVVIYTANEVRKARPKS